MSEDNEEQLILLAAKAAGLKVQYSNNYGDFSIGEPYSRGEVRWNPLTDDGDAFRLAVRLDLFDENGLFIHALAVAMNEFPGALQATRYAIVRTAAEMGKGS